MTYTVDLGIANSLHSLAVSNGEAAQDQTALTLSTSGRCSSGLAVRQTNTGQMTVTAPHTE